MAGPIRISILANASQAKNELTTTSAKFADFGKKAAKFVGVGMLAAGAAIAKFGFDSSKAASDAQQSLGATETIFGKFADSVIKSSDRAASKYGLSANTYRESANLIGSLFKNQGVTVDKLAGKTDSMIGTASDLAATFGGTTADAVGALSGAFKGEFDPLERYGISIKASDIAARLAAKGQSKLTGEALKQAQQMATSELIMRQSSSSTGAFAKESNTLAGQQQRLAAKFENVKVTVGNYLIPVLTRLTTWVSDVGLPGLKNLGGQLQEKLGPAFEAVKNAVVAMQPIFEGIVNFIKANPETIKAFAITVGILTVAVGLWAGAQWLVNAALAANPIGIIIITIGALVAGLVYAYNNSETFRILISGVWSGIQTAVSAVLNFFQVTVPATFTTVRNAITGTWNTVLSWTTSTWNSITSAVSRAWNSIISAVGGAASAVRNTVSGAWGAVTGMTSSAWNSVLNIIGSIWGGIRNGVSAGINAVVGFLGGLYGRITGVFRGAGSWLYGIGQSIVSGLVSGISGAWRWVTDRVTSLINMIPYTIRRLMGIASPSKVMKGFGKNIAEGLALGIDQNAQRAARAASGLAVAVAAGFGTPALAMSATTAFAGTSSGAVVGNTYAITVQAPVGASSAEIGRTLVSHIESYEQSGGRRKA